MRFKDMLRDLRNKAGLTQEHTFGPSTSPRTRLAPTGDWPGRWVRVSNQSTVRPSRSGIGGNGHLAPAPRRPGDRSSGSPGAAEPRRILKNVL